MRSLPLLSLIVSALFLAACQSSPPPSAVTKLGKPYAVDGKTYTPAYDDNYDKVGKASWYGPGFHGKYTASGETFDQDELTAAHPTLPMPSLVRVTNLENGKSVVVRINDRGPFKSNRIIDLSKKAAETLGIRSTAQVRVQYLKAESAEYMTSLQSGKPISMAEYNARGGDARIVEEADASTHAGDTVSSAAPVMTVNSGEMAPAPAKAPASHGPSLIRPAMADDAVTSSESPATLSDTPAEEPAAAAKPKPESKPAASAKAAKGIYVIQAGVFASETNARKLVSRIEGVVSTVDQLEKDGKTWWRVHFGPFTDKALADEVLAKVQKSGAPDARLAKQ